MPLVLSSPAFGNGEPIPQRYTCEGDNLSPPLEWSGTPPSTKSLVLILEDPDAPSGTFRHWGLYNIAAARTMLPEGVGHGVKTEDLGMGVNDFGHPRYDGPCPPVGHGRHRYRFRLAALDVATLNPAPKARVAEIWAAAEPHIIEQAELVGLFSR